MVKSAAEQPNDCSRAFQDTVGSAAEIPSVSTLSGRLNHIHEIK